MLILQALVVFSLLLLIWNDTVCAQRPAIRPLQCESSSDESGYVITPNIPDFYFTPENAASFSSGPRANLSTSRNEITYIYITPSEAAESNCSSYFVYTQYCYQIRRGETSQRLLFLIRGGFDFIVIDSIPVLSDPQERTCTDASGPNEQICCESTLLDFLDQVQVFRYAIGIGNFNSDAPLLAFDRGDKDFNVEHFQVLLNVSAVAVFTISEGDLVNDGSFLLLRTSIGPDIGFFTVLPANPTRNSNEIVPDDTNESQTTVSSSMSIGGTIGGTIAVGILLVVTWVAILIAAVLVVRKRIRKKTATQQSETAHVPTSHTNSQARPVHVYDYVEDAPNMSSNPAYTQNTTNPAYKRNTNKSHPGYRNTNINMAANQAYTRNSSTHGGNMGAHNQNVVTAINPAYNHRAVMNSPPSHHEAMLATEHVSNARNTSQIPTTNNESYATNPVMSVNPAYGYPEYL